MLLFTLTAHATGLMSCQQELVDGGCDAPDHVGVWTDLERLRVRVACTAQYTSPGGPSVTSVEDASWSPPWIAPATSSIDTQFVVVERCEAATLFEASVVLPPDSTVQVSNQNANPLLVETGPAPEEPEEEEVLEPPEDSDSTDTDLASDVASASCSVTGTGLLTPLVLLVLAPLVRRR